MKYAWIQAHQDSYPVAVLCRVLQVSASALCGSVSGLKITMGQSVLPTTRLPLRLPPSRSAWIRLTQTSDDLPLPGAPSTSLKPSS